MTVGPLTDVLLPIVLWWLALAVLGWAVVPLAYRLFPTLADRGLAFARPLGLLLTGYLYWLAGMAGVLPNSRLGAVVAALVVVLGGLYLARKDRDALTRFLRSHRNLILGYEALFALAFVAWAIYRAYNPAIETAGGEKYMEMAFIDGVLASPHFPPLDPWLSGFAISYYYFGYILAALLIQLTGILPYAAFNLLVPMTWAMTLLAAFGLGYNLVVLSGRSTRNQRLFTGGLTACLIGVIGSLEGAVELGFVRGWGPEGLYRWLDIRNLVPGGNSCGDDAPGFKAGGWIPARFIWWWRGSRVIHDKCGEIIHEFPFFSFMLGDVHPHLVALPYALVVLGLALSVLTGAFEREGERPLWSPRWLALPLVVGALGFLNAWDLPTYAFVVVIAYGLRAMARPAWEARLATSDRLLAGLAGLGVLGLGWHFAPRVLARMTGLPPESQPLLSRAALALALLMAAGLLVRLAWQRARGGDAVARRALDVGRFAVWLALLSIAFYLPFHLSFQSQASGIGVVTVRSRLGQWLVHFGFLFFLALSLVIPLLLAVRRRPFAFASLVVLAAALPFAVLSVVWQAWTALVLVVVVAAAAVAALQLWVSALDEEDGSGDEHDAVEEAAAAESAAPETGAAARFAWPGEGGLPVAPTFALVCLAVGLLMPLGTEFLFIRDLFGSRMNTIFKLYYQAWALLAIGGGFTAFALTRLWTPVAVRVWAIPAALLMAASLVYPAMATYSRTNGFHADRLTLNGLQWWENANPDDVAAVAWLKANAKDTPVVLEAHGGGYEHNGRISMATGFPTVLGWEGHEHQWRGTREQIEPRASDIQLIYKGAGGDAEFKELLEKYHVRYVVVGEPEKAKYGLTQVDLDRIRRELKPVFESGRLQIFENP